MVQSGTSLNEYLGTHCLIPTVITMHQKHSTWKSPALVVLTTHQQSWRAACTKQSQQLTNTWCRHNSQAPNNTTLYVSLTRWESNFAQTFNMSTCSLFSFVRMSKDTQRERERKCESWGNKKVTSSTMFYSLSLMFPESNVRADQEYRCVRSDRHTVSLSLARVKSLRENRLLAHLWRMCDMWRRLRDCKPRCLCDICVTARLWHVSGQDVWRVYVM